MIKPYSPKHHTVLEQSYRRNRQEGRQRHCLSTQNPEHMPIGYQGHLQNVRPKLEYAVPGTNC